MITNYNNFNIDESIYNQKDIDEILDKGFLNFNESDFTVLRSYATDDKELKELLKKIKRYREPFEKLNASLKDEKGIKKQECFRKWLELHEELSELEKELRYKFKIEDPRKIKKLEESLNFNENYKFNCILITINNVEEASIAREIINKFCVKFGIDNTRVTDFFRNIVHSDSLEEPIYARLVTSDYDNVLVLSWGRMSRFQENQIDSNYSYEKFFTIRDLEEGVLDNIKMYGRSIAKPSYQPRKIDRTLESNEPISDVYKKKLSYSKYNPIVVRIADQEDKDYFFDLVGWYGVFPDYELGDYPIGTDYVLILKELTNLALEPFRIGFTDDFNHYDSGDFVRENPNTYPKLLTPSDLYYVLKELLGIPDAKSMYSPKKIIHSIDEAVKKWPYRFKTREEFENQYEQDWESKIQYINPDDDIGCSWSGQMDNLLGQPCEIEGIDMSLNQRYHLPTNMIDRGYWIITNEMLIKNKPTEPSYAPRKIDRTLLESKNDDITIEKLLKTEKKFVIKCWKKDWDIVETNLLKNNIKWIRNQRGVSLLGTLSNTLERYPYIFFEISKDRILTWADPSEYNSYDADITLDTDDTIKKFFNVAPSYAPRKFERTLEAKESEKYKHLIFKIETLSDFRKAQEELFKQEYIWITDATRVQDSARDEDYPIYIFVNSETVRFHRRRFFYECTSLLDSGSVTHTIIHRQEGSSSEDICPKIFGINDISNIHRLFNHQQPPSYTPRKFNRTFEGFLFEALDKDTKEVSIIIENEKDNERVQRDLFQLGYLWGMTDKYVHTIREGLNEHIISFYLGNKQIVWCSSREEFEHFRHAGWRQDPTIYTIDDWSKIMIFLRYGSDRPSYTPRKMNRTLESTTWYPYRVKTENELIEEFGGSWRREVFDVVGWNPAMYYLLGIDYTEEHFSMEHRQQDDEVTIRDLSGNRWIIPCMALIKNEPIRIPSYKPKKTVRTLESINEFFLTGGEPINKMPLYDVVVFKINNIRDSRKIQNELFKEGFRWCSGNHGLIDLSSGILPFYFYVDRNEKWFFYEQERSVEEDVFLNIKRKIDGEKYRNVKICKKIFNINDINNLSSLFIIEPSYAPKKMDRTLENLNEAFKFISDNRDLTRLSNKPKFMIGDVVTIRPNGLDIHMRNIEGKYAEMDHIKEWIDKHEGKKLTVASLACQQESDLWVMDCVDEFNSNNYVQQDALMKSVPSYQPRTMDRTLESTDFEQSLIKKIQSVLTPDLLNPEWAKKLETGKHHPYAGHCYAASEALYHLLGGKEKGYKPMRGKGLNNESHWWIVDKDGNKLDPTAEQFYFVGLKPPYEAGKGNGFLTKTPSKRAKEIISKISNI